MTIDTSQTIEIEGAPLNVAFVVAITGLATAACTVVVLASAGDASNDAIWGMVGFVFFGLCTIIAARYMASLKGAVLTISPEGIRDLRVAREIIPWSAVRKISSVMSNGQRVMFLSIDPGIEARLTPSPASKGFGGHRRPSGEQGIGIPVQGLKTDYDTLLMTCALYVRAARQEPADNVRRLYA